MRDSKAVVYRHSLKCDVCGFEESHDLPTYEEPRGRNKIAWTREWGTIPSLAKNFTGPDRLDVCSRACAEKHVADFLDSEFRR